MTNTVERIKEYGKCPRCKKEMTSEQELTTIIFRNECRGAHETCLTDRK